MTIQILPEAIANQIAAGEVVERPASVVKELLENAIDAGATHIRVEIHKAGKESIAVIDNGSGLNAEDAALAFARHATSKVRQADDLSGIESLGFRGEALPSIASVARVRMVSGTGETGAGTEVRIDGGGSPKIKATSHPRGTRVEVGDLFFNTPARRKFLKADSTESAHITQGVTQQALARPEIHFSLHSNGRKVIDTLPTDQLLYRIAELFGPDLARELVRVEAAEGPYRLEGYISSAVLTKNNRNTQYSFVNQRFVRDKVILSATQMGYSHLLPRGQHPVLFLYLQMDPELVDVNVHPAKAEVRFAYQGELHRFIMSSIKRALEENVKQFASESPAQGLPDPVRQAPADIPIAAGTSTFQNSRTETPAFTRPQQNAGAGTAGGLPLARAWGQFVQSSSGPVADTVLAGQTLPFEGNPRAISDLMYGEFEPVGQLDRSFIIMQGKAGILVVDQHIAHERVLYERFHKAALNKSVEIQTLLFPLAVEFSPAEASLMSEHLEALKEIGLELEPFGQQGFLLRAVPAILKNQDHEGVLRHIVELLARDQGSEAALNKRYEEIQIMMACRTAITINHTLNLDQIRKLIFDLEQTQMPYTCPHGRPIALLFEMQDILRRFHRK